MAQFAFKIDDRHDGSDGRVGNFFPVHGTRCITRLQVAMVKTFAFLFDISSVRSQAVILSGICGIKTRRSGLDMAWR